MLALILLPVVNADALRDIADSIAIVGNPKRSGSKTTFASRELALVGSPKEFPPESNGRAVPDPRARGNHPGKDSIEPTNPGGVADSPGPNPAKQSTTVRTFREVDTLFGNPGQGWMTSERQPSATMRFPYRVVYLRYDWTDIEPTEGQYNWKLIDDAIEAWKSTGARISMRVMTANAHSGGYYSTPKWVFDAGVKGTEYLVGGADPTSGGTRITRIEPDYSDPVFLAKHARFLAALGKRYDGSPNLEFLDIGSYGIWGEWHTKRPAPIEVRRQIVDMYANAFQKTPLVFMTDDAEVLPYALAKGAGLRRDGVGSPWHEQNWIGSPRYKSVTAMADTWKRKPIVFEWFGDYAYLKSQGWSFDAAVNFMLTNHVTMINDNIWNAPPEAQPALDRLTRLAGYRFVLRQVEHPSSPVAKGPFRVEMEWENVGVGKLYRPYYLTLSVRNAKGNEIATVKDPITADHWLPGKIRSTLSVRLPKKLAKGTYTLWVSLVDPTHHTSPLNLAFDAPSREGWYEISKLESR